MITSRDIVTHYISWEVNSGTQIKFWRDSWNGSPPFFNLDLTNIIVTHSENSWGKYLIDFVLAICLFSKKVIWKDPCELLISPMDQARLHQILSTLVVYISRKEDRVIWIPGKNGSYSIKEGYRLIQKIENNKFPSRAFSFC